MKKGQFTFGTTSRGLLTFTPRTIPRIAQKFPYFLGNIPQFSPTSSKNILLTDFSPIPSRMSSPTQPLPGFPPVNPLWTPSRTRSPSALQEKATSDLIFIRITAKHERNFTFQIHAFLHMENRRWRSFHSGSSLHFTMSTISIMWPGTPLELKSSLPNPIPHQQAKQPLLQCFVKKNRPLCVSLCQLCAHCHQLSSGMNTVGTSSPDTPHGPPPTPTSAGRGRARLQLRVMEAVTGPPVA